MSPGRGGPGLDPEGMGTSRGGHKQRSRGLSDCLMACSARAGDFYSGVR